MSVCQWAILLWITKGEIMNLVIKKLSEINDAIDKLRMKKMKVEEVHAFVALVNAAHKWANFALEAYAVESKNRRVLKDLHKMNILDGDTAIQIGVCPANDAIKCSGKEGKIITREECLDYSGTHVDDCRSCEQFPISRRVLLGIIDDLGDEEV